LATLAERQCDDRVVFAYRFDDALVDGTAIKVF
jgi:hypothetical protein